MGARAAGRQSRSARPSAEAIGLVLADWTTVLTRIAMADPTASPIERAAIEWGRDAGATAQLLVAIAAG